MPHEGELMANLAIVVGQIKKERDRAAKEVQVLDTALAALNGFGRRTKVGRPKRRRHLSAAGRKAIQRAQRARWAKARAPKK